MKFKKYKHWFVLVLQLLGISLNGQIFFLIAWVRRYSRQNVFSSYSHKSNEQTIQSHMPLSNSVVCIVEVLVVDEQLGRHRSKKHNSVWVLALYFVHLNHLTNLWIFSLFPVKYRVSNLYSKSEFIQKTIMIRSSSDTMK